MQSGKVYPVITQISALVYFRLRILTHRVILGPTFEACGHRTSQQCRLLRLGIIHSNLVKCHLSIILFRLSNRFEISQGTRQWWCAKVTDFWTNEMDVMDSSQRPSNAELWCFFELNLDKPLNKQSSCLQLLPWCPSYVILNGITCPVPGRTMQTHYDDVIMSAVASQITSLTIVCSMVYSGADQRKHESSASLAFVRGIHRGPVNSPHKWPVTRKSFPFDDVIMG